MLNKERMTLTELSDYLQELITETSMVLDRIDSFSNGYVAMAKEVKEVLDNHGTI